jgi:hypothetical protein
MQTSTPPENHPDTPLGGVQILPTDTDGQGHTVNQTTTTDPRGEFWFEHLLPGSYTVTEDPPADSVPTTPQVVGPLALASRQELVAFAGQAMLGTNDPRVEVVLGKPLFFGNTFPGSVHGFKFLDRDGDGHDEPRPTLVIPGRIP